MGNTAHVQARWWDPAEAASVSKGTKALAESVDDRWVGSYSTTTDQTSKTGALITAGKRNILGFLEGVGLRAYSRFGTFIPGNPSATDQWRVVPVRGIDYIIGIANPTTDANGLFTIAHPFGVNVTADLIQEKAGPDPAATDVEARLSVKVIARDVGQVSFRAWNLFPGGGITTPQVYAFTALRFHYRIEKF